MDKSRSARTGESSAARKSEAAHVATALGPVRLAPAMTSPEAVLHLQRLAGNRAVTRTLQRRVRGRRRSDELAFIAPAPVEPAHVPVGQVREHAGGQSLRLNRSLLTRPATAGPAGRAHMLQRHSSWEHQLLGDAAPKDLAKIGSYKDLIGQTKKKKFFSLQDEKKVASIDIPGGGQLTKGQVMHVIAETLGRISDWQQSPPDQASDGKMDPKYQTVLLSIPGGKPGDLEIGLPPRRQIEPLIITYGEMNTLADFYGNVDAMKTADPAKRWFVVQSVRQESFFQLKRIYEELKSSLTNAEESKIHVRLAEKMMKGNKLYNKKIGQKFAKAITKTDLISGKVGQIDLLKLGGAGKSGSNEYAATLGRNACHFAPESWHAWSSYHQKGRAAAQEAHQHKTQGAQDKFSERLNEALINNGFGDHYLQDSYAAGHLVNKTQIMQFFVQWLDKNAGKMDFARDVNWRKIQAIAYKQPGLTSALQYDKTQVQGYDAGQTTNRAKNPQAVEDIEGDWMKRFKALGLGVPSSLMDPGSPSRHLMEWWQLMASKNRKTTLSGKAIAEGAGMNNDQLLRALRPLMADGIVSMDVFSADESGKMFSSGEKGLKEDADVSKTDFALRPEYVPKDARKFKDMFSLGKINEKKYQKMAAAVTYEDYFAFMNNGYAQKSTNALHDFFCKNGLYVRSGAGEQLFKVYGDDSMFEAESAKGVKHSGETANMSRDAIINLATTGSDGGKTTESILSRLPNQIMPHGGPKPISLADWHNKGKLQDFCEESIFPKMGVIDKAVGVFGDLSKFIHKDFAEKPHGADLF